MPPVKGQRVKVHYRGTLEDGSLFDTSEGHEPLEFEVGADQVIEGFESAVMEMEPGDKRSITLAPEQAYGERSESAVQVVPNEVFEEMPEPDQMVHLVAPDGTQFAALVLQILPDGVLLDFNHPLAGETLNFDLELVEVAPAA